MVAASFPPDISIIHFSNTQWEDSGCTKLSFGSVDRSLDSDLRSLIIVRPDGGGFMF